MKSLLKKVRRIVVMKKMNEKAMRQVNGGMWKCSVCGLKRLLWGQIAGAHQTKHIYKAIWCLW